jgi:GNAT superfamily N-acetyltransferase
MQIRLLSQSDDRFEVSHVYEEGWKSAYQGIIPQSYLKSIPRGRWVEWLNNDRQHSLIMLDGTRIVGTSAYGKERLGDMENCGEIISLYLLPEYWGKGYGKQLITAAALNLCQLGYQKICLWVLEENIRARTFYQSVGFKATNQFLKDYIGGRALREVQYLWQG